ncbi:2-deoxy-D-gluconate 3-dehydrogenase [Novosphingobium sp. CF614]|uniref:SDR family NAD(P)-dependent oxidoreductase n=1 Tax=Novosphingobium sp. CF614 TaxID=1884364 RepID=UPI0008E2C591|nr:SDR family NAD(P)-dependent oxidoreductase [Novosphingobium sp. CF614]SFF96191.1 2-deoxy-D-gluconate 3-dehydrogenase [Novosphingobium sp. CF614]
MKLQDKIALVIGASSGLGRASAEACAAEGAMVVLGDINEERSKAVIEGIVAKGGKAKFMYTDAMKEASIVETIAAVAKEFGRLDILVNSAGAPTAADEAGWHFQIDMYLKAPYFACREVLPIMEAQGGGSIITIGSLSSVTGSLAQKIEGTGYPAAKHAVLGMTKTLAIANGKHNIRVNCVCPGYIKSELTRPLYEAEDGGAKLINETLKVPLRRWGEPEEIGKVVAFLASEDASFITGQAILVDGGFMAR